MDDQIGTQLPDVGQDGIAYNSWLIYSTIRTTREYKYGKVRAYDGRPGKEWSGSLNEVIRALWPAIADASVIERAPANELKVAINRYLRNSRNVVCVHNGGVAAKSVWWISDHWSTLVVTGGKTQLIQDDVPTSGDVTDESPVSDDSAVFDVRIDDLTYPEPETVSSPLSDSSEEEEMDEKPAQSEPSTVGTGDEFTCRYDGCDRQFSGANYRVVHERSHGIRVNADGTVTMIKQNQARTDNDAVKTIINVVSDLPDKMVSGEQALELVRAADPVISAAQFRRAFNRLQAKPFNRYTLVKHVMTVETAPKAHSIRYELVRQDATPLDVAAAAKPKQSLVSDTFSRLMGEKAQGSSRSSVEADVMTHTANIRLLLNDLERLSKVEEGLKASSTRNYELVEKLRAVTKERDELKVEVEELRNKLNVLKSVFGDALK